MTSSNGGHVVGKEFDLGADEPLTHHASCSTRTLSWNSTAGGSAAPCERRLAFDEGVGIKRLCAPQAHRDDVEAENFAVAVGIHTGA